MNTDSLGSVIAALASNPALVNKLTDVIKNNVGGENGLSDLISGVRTQGAEKNASQDKENSVSDVPNVNLQPDTERDDSHEDEKGEAEPTSARQEVLPPDIMSKLPSILSLLGGASSSPKKSEDAKREALLKALKPYLNHSRAEAVDKVLELSKLGEILKKH